MWGNKKVLGKGGNSGMLLRWGLGGKKTGLTERGKINSNNWGRE